MTQFLRFPDFGTWYATALEAGFIVNGVLVAYTHTRAIDVVGTITRGGEYDPETGDVIVAPTVLAGFHVNYSGDLPETWAEFLVEPAAPYRVFA
jgi:hypothetical protein